WFPPLTAQLNTLMTPTATRTPVSTSTDTPPTRTPTLVPSLTPSLTPTNTPTSTPTNTPTPTPTATTGSSCSVHYAITSQWNTGFGATLTIKNTGSTTINSWSLQFSFANGQTITQLWNGAFTQSGGNVTITNLSYNGTIAPGTTLNNAPG